MTEIDSLKKLSFNSIPQNIKSRAFVYSWPISSNSSEPLQPNDIEPLRYLRITTVTAAASAASGGSETNSKPKSNPRFY